VKAHIRIEYPKLLNYRAMIGAGTTEVQKNIIADKALGMPRAGRP
jgi:hypothetical protein